MRRVRIQLVKLWLALFIGMFPMLLDKRCKDAYISAMRRMRI